MLCGTLRSVLKDCAKLMICIKEEGFLALCNPFKLIYKKKFILIELANFLSHGFLSEQIELQIEFLVWDLCIMRCSTIFNTILSPKNLVVCKTGQDSAELSNRNETRKVSQGKLEICVLHFEA